MPESLLLTSFDFAMIIAIIIGSIAVPALLVYHELRIAGKTALAILAAVATNAAVHTIASLLKILIRKFSALPPGPNWM